MGSAEEEFIGREELHNEEVDTAIDDGEESEESEDEEEEPPRLRYTRLTKLPARFFTKDAVSACHFHEKVFVFATHSGFIHLCQPDFTPIRTYKAHRASVLSIHTDGNFVASGSMDGTVVIGSIADPNDIIASDFQRPIHAVVLDGDYKTTKAFVSGGMAGDVILSTRNWLGRRTDTVLESGKGPITCIQTVGDIILWTNDVGITVSQISTRTPQLHVDLPDRFPRPDLYWPKVHFTDTDRFVIAWAGHVWFFRVSVGTDTRTSFVASTASSFKATEKKIEIEQEVQLEGTLVSGIADFNDDLMILNYVPPKLKAGSDEGRRKNYEPQPPELKIVNRETMEEDSVEEIPLNDKSSLGLNDYHLHHYVGADCSQWFLISANDGVIVQEFTLNDRLTWYVSKGKLWEAWNMSQGWLDATERLNIGLKQVDKFIEIGDWPAAAKFLQEVLSASNNSKTMFNRVLKEWENWLWIYHKSGHCEDIIDLIPYKQYGSDIGKDVYTEYLVYLLSEGKYYKFLEVVDTWDHALFDLGVVREKLIGLLNESDDLENQVSSLLRWSYINLSEEDDEPDACVEHLLILKDHWLMNFLSRHHLLVKYFDRLPEIITIDLSETERASEPNKVFGKLIDGVRVLVDNVHEITPESVVKLMEERNLDVVNYLYLEELTKIDSLLTNAFENQMIKLYARFNRDGLLGLLTKHKNYDIDIAIGVCQEMECTSELVYLYHKVGRDKEALSLIVDKLQDPERAISFATSVGDKELWDYLLDYSMNRPHFIRALMLTAGETMDAIPIVTRVPEKVAIPELRNALLNICFNNELDLRLNQIILKMISGEVLGVEMEYRSLLNKGYVFDTDAHEKLTTNTLVKFVDSEKPLLTEQELLGEDNVWRGVAKTISEKIMHMAYIQRLLTTSRQSTN